MSDARRPLSQVQTGLFGVVPALEVHLVAAHSRLLADGTSVSVAEHLRWSRGRTTSVTPRGRGALTVADEQLGLFGEEDSWGECGARRCAPAD